MGVILSACGHQPAPVSDRTAHAPRIKDKAHYTVRRGDTLYSIAFAAGRDFRSVARWNGISPPYRIYPGQRLSLVPTGRADRPRPRPAPSPPAGERFERVKGWVWPAQGRVVQKFAAARRHTGIEIAGRSGQGVHSAAPGKVVYAGSGLRGYGKLIIVKHNEVFLSAYAHNRKLLVREGIRVAAGERIAEMGNTGTNRVKLHFEIRKDGRPVDPLRYLPKR